MMVHDGAAYSIPAFCSCIMYNIVIVVLWWLLSSRLWKNIPFPFPFIFYLYNLWVRVCVCVYFTHDITLIYDRRIPRTIYDSVLLYMICLFFVYENNKQQTHQFLPLIYFVLIFYYHYFIKRFSVVQDVGCFTKKEKYYNTSLLATHIFATRIIFIVTLPLNA